MNLNCGICRKAYSPQKPHTPRILISCGHTACESCIMESLSLGQISCPQCQNVTKGSTLSQYPVNCTLIPLLKVEPLCQTHQGKLQAYCEKCMELVCLNCVLGNHKNHKVSAVADKVAKDRNILVQCMNNIKQSQVEIENGITLYNQNSNKLENQYKDHLLDICHCFNSIQTVLKEVQNRHLAKAKNDFQTLSQKYEKGLKELEEKKQFMVELAQIYEQVIALPNIQYLNEDNKRFFIIENCKFKKPKIESPKISLNRMDFLTEIQNAIQEMLVYEKKLQNQSTPSVKSKKGAKAKQPTILQVNLNEQYKKHFKNNSDVPNFTKSKAQRQKVQLAVSSSLHIEKTPKPQKQLYVQKMSVINSQFSEISSFHDNSLHLSMINSFMDSSRHSTTMKDSQASFTLLEHSPSIIHIGGFNQPSLQSRSSPISKQLPSVSPLPLALSKSQCVCLSNRILLLGGKIGEDRKTDQILQYDIDAHRFNTTNLKLSESKSGFAAFVKNNKVYIVGGSNQYQSLRTFQEYRIGNDTIYKNNLPNLLSPRDELGLVLGLDGHVYACGGINQSGSVLASCQRYNWDKYKWEHIASMNKPRRSFALVAVPHGIYAIGGYNGHTPLPDVEMFDYGKNKWVQVQPMSVPRFAHTALVTPDYRQIIVSGGFNYRALKSVQIMDVESGEWSTGSEMQVERFLHCSIIANI